MPREKYRKGRTASTHSDFFFLSLEVFTGTGIVLTTRGRLRTKLAAGRQGLHEVAVASDRSVMVRMT
jgi:hypothetical protein